MCKKGLKMGFKNKTCIGKKTGKPVTCYVTKEEAEESAAYIAKKVNPRLKLTAYKCSKCGYYHLSPADRKIESTTCNRCTDSNGKPKQLYKTKADALKRAQFRKEETGIKLYVYACPYNHGFHLTHKQHGF